MNPTMDKLMGTAGQAAQGVKKVTGRLVAQGRTQAERVALQGRLAKLQRQLGQVVYALKKNGEDNEPLIAFYVDELDKVKRKLARLERPRKDNVTVYGPKDGAEGREDAMFCGCGGDELS